MSEQKKCKGEELKKVKPYQDHTHKLMAELVTISITEVNKMSHCFNKDMNKSITQTKRKHNKSITITNKVR